MGVCPQDFSMINGKSYQTFGGACAKFFAPTFGHKLWGCYKRENCATTKTNLSDIFVDGNVSLGLKNWWLSLEPDIFIHDEWNQPLSLWFSPAWAWLSFTSCISSVIQRSSGTSPKVRQRCFLLVSKTVAFFITHWNPTQQPLLTRSKCINVPENGPIATMMLAFYSPRWRRKKYVGDFRLSSSAWSYRWFH